MSNPTLSESTVIPSVFVPAFPFVNAPGADAILQSSDGVDFYVHRNILALVSPVFRDMFALPQPESSPEIPIIPVQEDSAVLDRALRFFYPGTQSVIATLDELRDIIEVLVSKYDVECVIPRIKDRLVNLLVEKPVAVYVIALNHQWKDIALKAARESLKTPLRVVDAEAPPELDHIPASAYHNLLYYHACCATAAKNITEDLRWVGFEPTNHVWFSCTSCRRADPHWVLSDGGGYYARLWFNQYLLALGDVLYQTPGIDLNHHKTMLDALKNMVLQCGSNCREKAFEQLPQFVETCLAPKIKATMDQIELKI
ncbi:hypothetical protein B0H19DRAFT_975930 [Mycena capillaripes]|nr:hypothetical protein B0H19DRAFT_975930 [Mycena capillaripes]